MKKVVEQIVYIIIAGLLWYLFYSFLVNIHIVDDKQDIFLQDREMYQKEIWEMQKKLDKIQATLDEWFIITLE